MRFSRIVILLTLGTLVYIGSYLFLSPTGKYAPISWGLTQNDGLVPNRYQWAPTGFYNPKTGYWNNYLSFFYAPVLFVDDQLWHTHGNHPEIHNYPMFPNPDIRKMLKEENAAEQGAAANP